MRFIEKIEDGIHNYNRFSADFSDNRVRLNNQDYPLGAVSRMVANIDADAMTELLTYGAKTKYHYEAIYFQGYSKELFTQQKESILEMLDFMKTLEPFGCFDFEKSKKLVESLYSEDEMKLYDELVGINKPLSEEEYLHYKDIDKRFQYAQSLGLVYSYIAIDTANFATAVQNFTMRLMKNDSRKKSDLAQSANEFFNDDLTMFYLMKSNPAENLMRGFSVNSIQTTVPVIDTTDSTCKILRRIYFSRMMDFYVTDFFEGLRHGHYLWQCQICGRYFLMTSAHRQLYCDEVNPEYNVPCKYVAKHPEITKQKMDFQNKTVTPNHLLWKRRDNAIRKRKSRGKYSDSEFATARDYINRCYERSQIDFDYAKNQYEKDMELEVIDKEVSELSDV